MVVVEFPTCVFLVMLKSSDPTCLWVQWSVTIDNKDKDDMVIVNLIVIILELGYI